VDVQRRGKAERQLDRGFLDHPVEQCEDSKYTHQVELEFLVSRHAHRLPRRMGAKL